jgi:hypothetical protein
MKALVLLLLTSCGGLPTPTYTTRSGVEIYEGDAPGALPREAAEAIESWDLKTLPTLGGVYSRECVSRSLERAYVWVHPTPWRCSTSPTGLCSGEDGAGGAIGVLAARDGSPYHTALLHEYGHLAQQYCGSSYEPDLEHRETALWSLLDTAEF